MGNVTIEIGAPNDPVRLNRVYRPVIGTVRPGHLDTVTVTRQADELVGAFAELSLNLICNATWRTVELVEADDAIVIVSVAFGFRRAHDTGADTLQILCDVDDLVVVREALSRISLLENLAALDEALSAA